MEMLLKALGFLSLASLRCGPCHPFVIVSHPAILYHYYLCWKISVKYLSNFGAGTFKSLTSCLSAPLLSQLFILFIGLKSPFLFTSVTFARSHSTWVLAFLILVSSFLTSKVLLSLLSCLFSSLCWTLVDCHYPLLRWFTHSFTFRVIFTGFCFSLAWDTCWR